MKKNKGVLKRPISNHSVINAFKINNELGIMTSSFNMTGLPTENKEEIFEALKLNAAIMPDTVKLMTFYPFRNTPYIMASAKDSDLSIMIRRRKVQTAFNWYMNTFFNNDVSAEYDKMIKHIEGLAEEKWNNFDFYSADEEMSQKMRKKGLTHYSKFVNRSLAVKLPSRHFDIS